MSSQLIVKSIGFGLNRFLSDAQAANLGSTSRYMRKHYLIDRKTYSTEFTQTFETFNIGNSPHYFWIHCRNPIRCPINLPAMQRIRSRTWFGKFDQGQLVHMSHCDISTDLALGFISALRRHPHNVPERFRNTTFAQLIRQPGNLPQGSLAWIAFMRDNFQIQTFHDLIRQHPNSYVFDHEWFRTDQEMLATRDRFDIPLLYDVMHEQLPKPGIWHHPTSMEYVWWRDNIRPTMLEFQGRYFDNVHICMFRQIGFRWWKTPFLPWFVFHPITSFVHHGSVFVGADHTQPWMRVRHVCLQPHLCPRFIDRVSQIPIQPAHDMHNFEVSIQFHFNHISQLSLFRFSFPLDADITDLTLDQYGERVQVVVNSHRLTSTPAQFRRNIRLAINHDLSDIVNEATPNWVANWLLQF